VFRCEVWNRALPEKKKLISSVSLGVNCEYFLPQRRDSGSLIKPD
jgi:hypothetical protein